MREIGDSYASGEITVNMGTALVAGATQAYCPEYQDDIQRSLDYVINESSSN